MGNYRRKKSLWTRIKAFFLGKEKGLNEGSSGDIDFSATEAAPVDLQFVREFNKHGGKFLYCEQESEAYNYLTNISEESSIKSVYCANQDLCNQLDETGIKVTNSPSTADAFYSDCEHLVSFNGGIMLTDRQTHGLKYTELPEVFITIARTSQITKNLSSALSGIRAKYKGDIPSGISTVKGPSKKDSVTELGGSQFINKEIYLLLVEDQL